MFGSVKRPSLLVGELASVPGSNKSRLFFIEKKILERNNGAYYERTTQHSAQTTLGITIKKLQVKCMGENCRLAKWWLL